MSLMQTSRDPLDQTTQRKLAAKEAASPAVIEEIHLLQAHLLLCEAHWVVLQRLQGINSSEPVYGYGTNSTDT
jgi:hypothetical protein